MLPGAMAPGSRIHPEVYRWIREHMGSITCRWLQIGGLSSCKAWGHCYSFLEYAKGVCSGWTPNSGFRVL